jgi:hypothetical protein
MPARTGNTYTTPKGVVTRSKSGKAKSFTGKGAAPAGTKKVAEKSYSEVPTVTVAPDGSVSTSGYGRKSVAKRAVRSQAKRARKVQRIVAETRRDSHKRAVKVTPPKRYDAPLPKPSKASRVFDPNPQTAVISSVPNPNSKPPIFQGHETAGEPSRRELKKAAKKGALRVNRKGQVTTPRIRKVGGELRRLRSKARSSNAPLPGLDAEQTKVARKVLRTGKRQGASRKELLAAAETGLVESGFRNLDYGDADSQGWRQERTSIYGTSEPRNVKAGARNFFQESVSDTGGARGRGQTAGELAQTIQGSAFPERYDEHKPEAAAIVRAFSKGSLKPAQQKRLQKVSKEAQKLGLRSAKPKGTKVAGPSRIPSVVYIGKQAEKKFGLSVGENPAFGGVAPVHVSDSYHYRTDSKGRGEAIDVSGDPEKMMAFDHWVAQKWGQGVTELFYDPGISIKEGTEIGAIGGHGDHVHVAVAMPGEKIAGGMTAGPGGAVFVGYGSSASAAEASATNAQREASKGKAKRVSPWKRYWNIKKQLHNLGVGESSTTTSHSSGSVLSAMERKYGVAA